jgi:hypothetical protein
VIETVAAAVVVGLAAVAALTLWILERPRKPRLEVKLDEVTSLGSPIPLKADGYTIHDEQQKCMGEVAVREYGPERGAYRSLCFWEGMIMSYCWGS